MDDHWKKKAQEARRNNLSSQIEVWREWKEDEQYGTQNIGLRFFVDTLVEEYERLRKALHIEQQIVEAFYQYRMDCCFDHCEAWMVEHGYRVVVFDDEDNPTSCLTEWACEVGQ